MVEPGAETKDQDRRRPGGRRCAQFWWDSVSVLVEEAQGDGQLTVGDVNLQVGLEILIRKPSAYGHS
jgi:hypothetical protein